MIGDTMIRLTGLSMPWLTTTTRVEWKIHRRSRKTLLHKIAEAKDVLRIQQQNAARQPLLHEPLEQDRVVRPQLLARAASAPKAAAALTGVTPGGVKP
jgi:hypothetical protein